MTPSTEKAEQPQSPKPIAFYDLDFDGMYATAAQQNDIVAKRASLNDKVFTIKDGGGVSYRLINHWMKEGLIDDGREDPSKGWRKLSIKDVVWLHIIRDLRRFGLPIEKIRAVHQSLMCDAKHGSRDLELAILLCATTPPMNFFIVVFDDGNARLATLQSLWYNEAVKGYAEPYIRISLNALVCTALASDKYAPERVHPIVLTGEEIDVVGSLRQGDFDTLHIYTKQGELHRIDKSSAVRDPKRLHEVLADIRFGEMTVKVENGKIVHRNIVKQEKL